MTDTNGGENDAEEEVEDELLLEIQQSIIDLEEDRTEELTKQAIDEGYDPLDILQKGLTKGVKTVGDKFGRGEVFLPELAMSADCMRAGVQHVDPLLADLELDDEDTGGKFLIGTVDEDIHNIGKNILITMLKANGFEVVDLGVEIPNEEFVEAVKEHDPDILGMSALMTMTMDHQEEVIELLEEEGLRDDLKIMVGGAPTSKEWCEEIGADGYGDNADAAVEVAKELVEEHRAAKA
ncbi:5-methyltetrahydrofolate--homocysteine methyltransferase [Halalkaliarchaeum desulfuricum]|uniref:5-methyltetrahydrofolate--homocysteine methyltransferase n=1 Tax=Halalkaliarchaeum desulfuricum TaxID=2055893 RepID=A0A343TGA1_9EURY|nr:corrinoid protein [Halalkaliarchaeum desulfuricum]AUX08123.1 5-methyltetrahydrofolate--homocysteine methyltransferase [Halalkaliarchaeum desulfuricum]